MKDNKLRLFVAASCASCNEVSQLLREGKANVMPDEVIDLEEHIEWAEKLRFTRGIPAAFQGSRQCQLGVQGNDEGRQLMIKCPS